MELDLRRTLDTLKWAPKVWRPERSWRSDRGTMRKVQSDPCFTSTFTKLPAVFTRPPHVATIASRKTDNLDHVSSPSSRLMQGPTLQVGKVNAPSKVVSLPNLHSGFQGDLGATSLSQHHRKTLLKKETTVNDVEDQLKEFEESLEEVQTCMTNCYTSIQAFEGIRPGDTRKSLTKRGSRLSLHSLQIIENDEGDKEGDSQKARLLQYRYVRKIEPEAPPLERPQEEACLRIDEGSIVLRNQSDEYIQKFTTKGRKLAKTQGFAKRDLNLKGAQSRRLQLEQQKQAERLEKVALYEQRLASVAARQKDSSKMETEVRGTEARLKEMQTQKWQSLLAIIGFMQMCSLLHEKYNSVKTDYIKYLREENIALMDPCTSDRGLPAFVGEHMLSMRFAMVARQHMKAEWRLHPAARSVWHASVRSALPAIGNQEAKHKRPQTKEQDKKTTDAVKCFYVELPSRQLMLSHQRNSLFLQAIMVGRFRAMKKRKASRAITDCLTRWRKSGSILVCMMSWMKSVKRIQRFWRWARKHLAQVRAKVEVEWQRVERNLIAMHVLPVSAFKDPTYVPHHRMTTIADNHHHPHLHHRHTVADLSPREKQPSPSQAKPPHADGEAVTPGKNPHEVKPTQCVGRRRMSQVNQNALNHAMMNDERRRRFLKQELRVRRKKYLPDFAIWQMEMHTYQQDVQRWREHRKTCRADGVRPFMDMPSIPPRPSCLPSEEDLQEMVQRAIGLKEPEVVVKRLRRTSTNLRDSWYGGTDEVEDDECSSQLSAERTTALAPSPSRPVPYLQRQGSMLKH